MKRWQAAAVVAFVVLAGLVAVAMVALDPLRDIVSFENGNMVFRGGTFDGTLFNYLQRGPSPGNATWERWYMASDGYVTAAWRMADVRVQAGQGTGSAWAPPSWRDVVRGLDAMGKALTDALGGVGHALGGILGLFIQDARALCGDGASTCTWDNGGGDGLWNTATNWSNNAAPVAGDSVLFDATSNTAASVNVASAALTAFTVTTGYSSTITVNATQTATWGTVSFTGTSTGTISTNGFAVIFGSFTGLAGTTLTAGASTITVNGNWNSSAGTFTVGTSTVVLAATGNVAVPAPGVQSFNNLTINASVTSTITSSRIHNVATLTLGVNAVLQSSGASVQVQVLTDLVLGAGANVAEVDLSWCAGGNVPGATYYAMYVSCANVVIAGAVTLNGTISWFGTTVGLAIASGGTFNSNGFSLTSTNGIELRNNTPGTPAVLIAGTSTVSSGRVDILDSSNYITSTAAGSWTVSGTWTDNSTSVSWSFAAPMTFTSATGGTMTFAGTNLAGAEFANVTFTSSAGTAQTFTMATRGLNLSGTLTVSDGTSTTALTTSGSNLAITAGQISVAAGGILTANASTMTLNGSGTVWSSTGGTFTPGTSTVAVTTTGTLAMDETFSSMTTTAGITATFTQNVAFTGTFTANSATLSLQGGWDSSAGTFTYGTSNLVFTASATLKVAAGATYGTSEVYNLTANAAVTITVSTNSIGIANVLNLGANAVFNPVSTATYFNSASAAPLVLGAGAAITNSGAVNAIVWNISVDWSLPAGTYTLVSFQVENNKGSALTVTAAGAVVLSGASTDLYISDVNGANGLVILAMGANNLTVGGLVSAGFAANTGALTFTTGQLTDPGAFSVVGAASYVQWGAGPHTIAGAYSNASTSASWAVGTALVTFTRSVSGNMTFGNLGADEFYAVTFTSSSAAPVTFTMLTNGLRFQNALTVSDGVSTTTLATSNLALSNFTLGSTFTIGTGGIVSAGASTITLAGNFVFYQGTFTYGTSTVLFAATAQVRPSTITLGVPATNNFFNLQVQVGATLTVNDGDFGSNQTVGIGGVLTLNGAITVSPSDTSIYFNSASAAPLVLGAGYSFGAFVGLQIDDSVSFSLPAATYPGLQLDPTAASVTVTMAGNVITSSGTGTGVSLNQNTANTLILDTNGFNLTTIGGGLTLAGQVGTAVAVVQWKAGTHTIGGNVSIGSANAGQNQSYMTWTSGSLTVSGGYVSFSINAAWDASTGQAVFTASAAGTFTFAGTNLAEDEFATVTFRSTSAGAYTFQLSVRGLRVGVLNVSDTVSTTTLDLNAQTVDVNGNITIGTGGILLFSGGTLSCSGSSVDINGSVSPTGGGTFTLDGTNQTVSSGGSTWPTVSMQTSGGNKTWDESFGIGAVTLDFGVTFTISAGVTMTVTNGVTHTYNGTLEWNGVAGTIIITSGAVWFANASTRQQVRFVDVANSNASGGTMIENCVGGIDHGGNVNWAFPGTLECGEGLTGGPLDLPGGTDFTCTHIFLRLVCKDESDYTGDELVTRVEWWYNGEVIATSTPGQWVVINVGSEIMDWGDATIQLTMHIVYNTQTGGGPTVTHLVTLNNWTKPLFIFIAFALLAYVARAVSRASTVAMAPRPRNPSYRRSAISVEEYPPGWRSYRQKDPAQYDGKFTSRKMRINGKLVWVVYGLKEATPVQRRRTGRKTVAEIQTVRERIDT